MKRLFAVLVLVLFVLIPVFADDPETVEPETPVVSEEAPEAEAVEPEVPETTSRPTVALVLSGGGAKGIAHISIIEALERYGIPIDKVYGTSMGALIGGLYAAGLSPGEMKEIVLGNDLTQLFTVFDSAGYTEVLDAFDYNSSNVLSLSLGQGIGGVNGFIDDYLVLNFFNKFIGNVPDNLNFDTDLVVPFECNAADMLTGDEVIFREGSLITAMRSSMSLPLIFEPVVLEDGSVYMDGGIVSNYIVHRAVEEGYDIIIVVTLNAYGKNKYTAENYTSLSGTAGSTLQTILNNVSKGEVEMADYWFSPDLSGYNTLSFGEAEGILARGDREAEEQQAKLEDIAALFTEEQKVYKDPNR
ncbi:MAG: patatin-like phospholipase family protein, partial [Spirochaetales bacterium]|nr:patatin-like phospholipase family protein [Spirochaetales bacterium]